MKLHLVSIVLLALCSCASIPETSAATILTKSYKITLLENCNEDVACQDVKFTAEKIDNGKRVRLNGRSVTSICNDGVTACHHLGYKFVDGSTTYFVSDDNWFDISRGDQVLLHEEIISWDRD